jgi:drug/metabolite transporter (DMT)-like permease
MLFGIAGVIYIVVNTDTASGNDTPIGIIFMFLAVISGALYGAFSRKTSKGGEFSSWDVTCFASFAGAIAFNGANIVKRLSDGTITEYFKPLENVDNIIGFIFLAVFCTVIGTGMNNIALSKIEPLRITAFSGVCTIVTIVEGVLIGGEKLELFHIIGTVLIVASVFGVNYFAVRHIKIIDDFKHYIKERKSSSK